MEIILRQAVENLGKPGDVVSVKNGYARNFLLPRGIAFEATPGNLKRIAQERGRLEAAAREGRLGVAQSIVGRMRDLGGGADLVSGPGQGAEWELFLPRSRP